MVTIDTVKGMLYGLAVGDALGVPYEFMERGTFECTGMVGGGTWNQPAGTWSDDTSMTLATMDSMAERGGVDVEDMRARFEIWHRGDGYTCNGEVFDIGGTTATALEQGYGCSDEWSNGNGSLMRIIPLALMPEICTIEDVVRVSSITHAHPIACMYCYALTEWAMAMQYGAVGIQDDRTEDEIRSGGYVGDTFDAALWCVVTSASYAETVLKAVNLGGDTDTTAAVAGGLAGILYGYGGIPDEWIRTLRNKEALDGVLGKWEKITESQI